MENDLIPYRMLERMDVGRDNPPVEIYSALDQIVEKRPEPVDYGLSRVLLGQYSMNPQGEIEGLNSAYRAGKIAPIYS